MILKTYIKNIEINLFNQQNKLNRVKVLNLNTVSHYKLIIFFKFNKINDCDCKNRNADLIVGKS